MQNYWRARRLRHDLKKLAILRRHLVAVQSARDSAWLVLKSSISAIPESFVREWMRLEEEAALNRYDIELLVAKLKTSGIEHP